MPVHFRGGQVSLVIDPATLTILHWGGKLSSAAAHALPTAAHGRPLLPLQAQGHQGRPGLRGHRNGLAWSPSFTPGEPESNNERAVFHARDAHSQLSWHAELELHQGGLLRLRHGLRNDGATGYRLDDLTPMLPLPARATELLDFTGRWAKERQPQRTPLGHGAWLRESRRGRPGHDSAFLLSAGTPGFAFETGEVWSVHVGWSGDQRCLAERLPSGDAFLGGGELLLPGEVELAPGQEYVTPWLYAAYSPHGLNGIADAFHEWQRARTGRPPRPVVLNTWEATYFDHDLGRLRDLADRAAEAGVERFVLDDGWFRGRRDDTAGLGDWHVDETVWPGGLGPLISSVRERGMDFGLWVEPEMVNLDSGLARDHPEWILHAADRLPPPWRNQQVLDLSNTDVYDYLLNRLDALLRENDISYLKWDHNGDLVEAGHEGRAATRTQTLAVYRLLDELRRRHPDVEIESCASGGARIDLGILDRTDRVWTSDSNDAVERRDIQRHTNLLLPLELTGAHIGPPRAHSSGRTHGLGFRAGTALFGSLGVEWDLTGATDAERAELAQWIALYRRFRGLLHSGRLRQLDHPDPAVQVTAVVAEDASEALAGYAQLDSSLTERPVPVRIGGLDEAAVYRVRAVGPDPPPSALARFTPPPAWCSEPVTYPGQVLTEAGLPAPALDPETLVVLHVTRTAHSPTP